MLYVFHVDTGTTFTFDIKLALASVSDLKEAIDRECGVAVGQQVLLMSGGESLEPHARVCSYSAGTDTNPIYLFSKAAIESQVPPQPSLDYGSDVDLQSQVDASLAMPATYQTLVARAQLAQHCCGLARDQTRICERLVHDQHLQQQGWAAVVANLEDITQTFQARAEMLQQNLAAYLAERQQHMNLLENFSEDLRTLEKIPILPALRAHAEGLSPEEKSDSGTASTMSTSQYQASLLKWISAKDNQSSLEQVAEQCSRGLDQFDERVMETLKSEVSYAIQGANKQDMKEIKGLGERLFALEQLMAQTKRLVHEQQELSQGFQQNKTRVSNLNDESVLPDLCMSHRKQLEVMLKNHHHLRDIRRRCTKAKEELSGNIHKRLKWIMYVENKMMEVDSKLVMYHESLRRLRRQLEILRQIHLAPQMYVSAIAEVVRRRAFSQAFLAWASNLACQLMSVHNEEIERRREFQNKFEGHFLKTLFPGLEDAPPPFATQAPPVFDNGLPKLDSQDMELLKEKIPDLANSISTPDLSSVTQFFSKSETKDSRETQEQAPRPPLIADRGGFESDTEEFEKIGQAAMDSKSYEKQESTPSHQKQMEVGASTSSTSTNTSHFNRSSEHFPSQSIFDKHPSPLAEYGECSSSPNSPLAITVSSCDGQPKKLSSNGSSPSVGVGNNDFLGTEFYMDESLPSSLSEHPIDSQHQAIVSLLQENLANTRQEVERLRAVIRSLKHVAMDSLLVLRRELTIMKEQVDRSRVVQLIQEIGDAVKVHARVLREREQEIAVDHKLELADLKKTLQARDDQIDNLKRTVLEKQTESSEQERLVITMRQKFESEQQEMKDLRAMYRQMEEKLKETQESSVAKEVEENGILRESLDKCQKKILELELKIAALQVEYEKAIKGETEKLQLEYKAQYEAMRSRFKLMHASTMERSPSDSSLEKIERADILEAIIAQPDAKRDECKRALQEERLKNMELDESVKANEIQVSESKKVRLQADGDSMNAKLDSLETENVRLTAELKVSRDSQELLESKLEALESEKSRLEGELVKERLKRTLECITSSSSVVSEVGREKDMNASVVALNSRVDASTSTDRGRRDTVVTVSTRDTRSTSYGKITYASCNPGDIVLVTWDQAHKNYTVLQDSQTYYFLNSDCATDMDLKLSSDGHPNKLHVIAQVVDKEYCSARKPENRYRVPQGTKFFRVRVKPLQRPIAVGKH